MGDYSDYTFENGCLPTRG
jgi:hypothetical protein